MLQRDKVHAAVGGVFFAFGLGVGLWSGASGAILTRAGVDSASLGIILTAYTGVYLVAMTAGGSLAHRFGIRPTLVGAAVLFAAALLGLLNAQSVASVASLLVVSGFLGGLLDVAMNSEGARIERSRGKPILARLHAAASAGVAAGAILGSLIAASAAPGAAGFIAAGGLAAAAAVYERTARSEAPRTPPRSPTARGLSFSPALIVLGLVLGASIAAETAALLWSALLLRAEAPGYAAFAGLGAAFFALCQATLRFNADGVRLMTSDRKIIVASFAVTAAGFAVTAFDAGFAASVAGFALIGLGTGAIVPCGFALAARQTPGRPAVGLSSASLFSALTRLPAPLATGAIAQAFSLPMAFGAIAAAAVAAGVGMALFGPAGGNDSIAGKD
ncbi:hypothetical protein DFR50_101118 [Roseiarcus fermentans]|uniref:Major facilitator superfamily (MFS) profile domain-containing protein n=1 Tax=Roseiarcus fermentans TaxID=1473586 RepID=A0A366FU12_9HYPH|nr:MFS transporter [Roseiarcus fermentans]RBP18174.1 hypothetical protein DFR50_101118 [Roseiarcus fermentans]